MFGRIISWYQKYDRSIVRDQLFGFFVTALFCIIWFPILATLHIVFYETVVYHTVKGWFSVDSGINWFFVNWLGITAIAYANYFRIVLREQYKKFSQERKDFLNEFKDE